MWLALALFLFVLISKNYMEIPPFSNANHHKRRKAKGYGKRTSIEAKAQAQNMRDLQLRNTLLESEEMPGFK
jgi:hypothetical protein